MRIFLLLFLVSSLYCSMEFLHKYDCSRKITRGKGLVTLDLSEFETGDSIYITYNTYEGEYDDFIYYQFSNKYPKSEYDFQYNDLKECYTDSTTSHEHNVSDGYGGYYIYYTYDYYYYYEFIKPENASYLIMEYDLSRSYAHYLYVDNTRLSYYAKATIIACTVVGAFVIGVIIVLIVKFRDKIHCPFNCDCNKTYSYNINTTSYNTNTKTDKLLNPVSSPPAENPDNSNENTDFSKPTPPPPPEEEPVQEAPPQATAGYDPNAGAEQPYYNQDNYNYNNVQQPNYYDQNYANNYQNPDPNAGYNPDPNAGYNPDPNAGYNNNYYAGGNAGYQ